VSRTLAWLPIGAVLSVAALLRLWNLGQNGYSREYYAAAVLSMLDSWHNTFFNSFDPGGFVSLDKPPVAIWVQALFAKLFGFSALNSLLPQVILGLAGIFLVYWIVRRTFGEGAALLAAIILAVAPGSVAVDRSNNLESCLIVVLISATYFAIRAAETGRLLHLVAAMLMIGIGFNVKMAAALVFAPTVVIVFFAFNRQYTLLRHLRYQALAGALMIAVALSWVLAFDLTPAGKRPYAGSTKNNSMLELVLKHNGTDRFTSAAPQKTGTQEPQPELYDNSPTGPLRLFRGLQAGQFAWLLPFALFGILAGFFQRGMTREQRIATAVWAGWLLSYWIVFSAAGGPFHTYYLAALAAPLAALAGIGASVGWQRHCDGNSQPIVALIAITGTWQAWLFYGQAGVAAPVWLLGIAAASCLLAAISIHLFVAGSRRYRPFLAIAPVVALLSLPVAAALSVVLVRPNVIAPVATLAEYSNAEQDDAARPNPRRRDTARAMLVTFLLENRGKEKFIVAVENALIAAPLIIATRLPVMATGGYLGTDPILTPGKFAELQASGAVRFAMVGGLSLTKRDRPEQIALRNAIKESGTVIDAARWSGVPHLAGKTFKIRLGGAWTEMEFPTLYDLRSTSGR
jgi:4-amino-4-deoxy-L-arabinose transferase-like glycosyltransferase